MDLSASLGKIFNGLPMQVSGILEIRFGIEDPLPADNGKGDLPRIALGLGCVRSDVQIMTDCVVPQGVFVQYRGEVADGYGFMDDQRMRGRAYIG